MRNAAYISAGMHVFIISMIYFGVPSLFPPAPVRELPIAVEIIDIGDKPARQAVKSNAAPEPEPDKPPPPKTMAPASRSIPTPPPPPPEPVVEAAPKAIPLPREKPKKAPPPLPRRKPQVAKKEPAPKPKRKPKPPPDPFDTLLRNLSKEAKRKPPKPAPEPEEQASLLPKDMLAARNKPRQNLSIDERRLVGTLAQMVISQITPCWSIPVGAKEAEAMQVGITITLNPDGTLRGIPRIDDQARMARDPFFRAVAESALRALRNPRCTPLRLPIKNYQTWKEISFNFDPKEVLGQ